MNDLERALKIVKAAGYKVSKPKEAKMSKCQVLNSLGLPRSPQFDPNYRMKYKPSSISRLMKPMWKYTLWKEDTKPVSSITRFDLCFLSNGEINEPSHAASN